MHKVLHIGLLYLFAFAAGLRAEAAPDATVGVPYFCACDFGLNAIFQQESALLGGAPAFSYDYRLLGGSLPPGLTVKTNAEISGTPMTDGNYMFFLALSLHINYQGQNSEIFLPIPFSINVTGF